MKTWKVIGFCRAWKIDTEKVSHLLHSTQVEKFECTCCLIHKNIIIKMCSIARGKLRVKAHQSAISSNNGEILCRTRKSVMSFLVLGCSLVSTLDACSRPKVLLLLDEERTKERKEHERKKKHNAISFMPSCTALLESFTLALLVATVLRRTMKRIKIQSI